MKVNYTSKYIAWLTELSNNSITYGNGVKLTLDSDQTNVLIGGYLNSVGGTEINQLSLSSVSASTGVNQWSYIANPISSSYYI
jgi:hypothetical protein